MKIAVLLCKVSLTKLRNTNLRHISFGSLYHKVLNKLTLYYPARVIIITYNMLLENKKKV